MSPKLAPVDEPEERLHKPEQGAFPHGLEKAGSVLPHAHCRPVSAFEG
jgi:hypothetical protein